MVLSAEPGTPSGERLRILSSWNAEPLGPSAPRGPAGHFGPEVFG